ncbi:MAG: hypothetical protein GEU26_14560 [Nitrososphaeraceae archaeon]|nr:hypothetical protein [Nitrososphaeraceae archaeon]
MTDGDDPDRILMDELRCKDESLTIEMFDVVSDPKEMLNVMLKKLQLYNETEAVLKESRILASSFFLTIYNTF